MTKTKNLLIKKNENHSKGFSSATARHARKFFKSKYGVRISFDGCMDGRVYFSTITGTQAGYIDETFKVAGTKFELGHPYFGKIKEEWCRGNISQGFRSLQIISYHFSASHQHLGCKGHGYDTEKARAWTYALAEQYRFMHDTEGQRFLPVVVGIETDSCSLVIHGEDPSNTFEVLKYPNAIVDEIKEKLFDLFPRAADELLAVVTEFILGNQKYIETHSKAVIAKLVNADHAEQVLVLGRGAEWIFQTTDEQNDPPLNNFALWICPVTNDYEHHIDVAFDLLVSNFEKGNIDPDDGIVFLSSGMYGAKEWDPSREHALLKADFFERVIKDRFKQSKSYEKLLPYVTFLQVVINRQTRKMEIIKEEIAKEIMQVKQELVEAN